jgi:hypothetical protein
MSVFTAFLACPAHPRRRGVGRDRSSCRWGRSPQEHALGGVLEPVCVWGLERDRCAWQGGETSVLSAESELALRDGVREFQGC